VPRRVVGLLAVLTLLGTRSGLQAQESPPVAASYATRFAEVMALQAAPDGVADVSNLVLRRDVGRFTMSSGKLYLLTPIGGRTVGALFRGSGTFSFAPASKIEQERLARFEKQTALDAPFTDLLLLFADTTLAELRTHLTFRAEAAPGEVRSRVRDGLKYLSDEDSQTFDPDLMSALLNGDTTDLFYAHIRRQGADPVMFTLNPHEVEAVSLSGKATRWWSEDREVLSQFPRAGQVTESHATGERLDAAEIRRYVVNIDLPQRGIGDIAFAATATLDVTATGFVGPWVAFELFDKLKVDSARWSTGEPATVFKGKDSGFLWVHLGSRLQPGEMRSLSLSYHGDLIDRIIDFFWIKSSVAWYPVSLEGRALATFDLTFHTPEAYLLASVGDRVDSIQTGRVITTRWVTPGPIRNASFNLGLFKDYTIRPMDGPPVTVMVSEEAHKKISQFHQRNMRQVVGADVTKSLLFFQSVYGPTKVKHFYATETPEFDGEAFPGMVDLSWVTFQQTDYQGADEVFRAHEVAHQWWGIGVDYKTYHDRWLSEGFAEFSGLWYMQTARQSTDKYFAMLERYRYSIFLRKEVPGPIALGHRVQSSRDHDVDDYGTIVYKKGAWVLHMLRIMMLDLKAMNEDRFTETMREFYQSYEGQRAATADFRRVVERHVGQDMGWFFDQWVYGTALPTYKVAYRTEPMADGQFRVKLQVTQEGVPDTFLAYVPVTLDLGKDRKAHIRVKVTGARSEIELPPMPAAPKSVKFNDLEGVLAEVKMVDWKS
jgi:peptidase M1-like protein